MTLVDIEVTIKSLWDTVKGTYLLCFIILSSNYHFPCLRAFVFPFMLSQPTVCKFRGDVPRQLYLFKLLAISRFHSFLSLCLSSTFVSLCTINIPQLATNFDFCADYLTMNPYVLDPNNALRHISDNEGESYNTCHCESVLRFPSPHYSFCFSVCDGGSFELEVT
jgi:hypothetical protein